MLFKKKIKVINTFHFKTTKKNKLKANPRSLSLILVSKIKLKKKKKSWIFPESGPSNWKSLDSQYAIFWRQVITFLNLVIMWELCCFSLWAGQCKLSNHMVLHFYVLKMFVVLYFRKRSLWSLILLHALQINLFFLSFLFNLNISISDSFWTLIMIYQQSSNNDGTPSVLD